MNTGMFAKMLSTIRGIPKGKVATYGDVAAASGYPGAARQVVWALRAGKAVPWHRVLGAGGRILLKGENGLEQRLRLRTEGVVIAGDRVEWLSGWHSEEEWLAAVHNTVYSNGVIGVTEALPALPVDERDFHAFARDMVRPDFLIFAKDH